jgi:hypothetical protein
MVALFVELLAIRWLSADIRAFTVFKTFPLVACFIGFGVGYARGNDKQLSFAAFGLLIFCLSMYVADQCEFCFWAFPRLSSQLPHFLDFTTSWTFPHLHVFSFSPRSAFRTM